MSDHNEPRRVPARKPGEPSPASQAKPTGNSMKDRLLAERRAAEAAAAGGARPSPAKPGASPARPAGARPTAPKPGGTSPKAPAAKPVVHSGARAARPTRAARATAGGEGGAGRHHRAREPKKKSVVPIIATGLVLVVGAVGAYYAMQMLDEDKAGDGTVAAADGAGTPVDVSGDEASAGATDGAGETLTGDESTDAAASEAAALDPEDEAALKAAKGLPGPKDPDSWNVIAITKNPNQVNDPNGVDLSKITPYGKPPGMDAEQWDGLVADAKSMFDPLSGAKGTRAETSLLEAGLNAWPAVTNEMLKLDPRRPDDNRTGKRAEVLLDKIRGGTTGGGFNWRLPETSDGELERKDLFYNLQLIVELHDVWRRHLAAPDRYFREKIAKGTVQAEMMGKEPATGDDEINVDDLDLSELGGGGGG